MIAKPISSTTVSLSVSCFIVSAFVFFLSAAVSFLPSCVSNLVISRPASTSILSFVICFFAASNLIAFLASTPLIASCSRNLDNPSCALACVSAFVRSIGSITSKNFSVVLVFTFLNKVGAFPSA